MNNPSRTTIDLNAELLNELSRFSTDNDKLRKVIDFVKSLGHKEEEKAHTAPPCQYTVEEMKQRVVEAMERCNRGEYYTTEEVMKSIEWL
ncbi:MAG: hypothetical protein LUE99_15160 [Bacteroides sp.]|nr:hypothetical protein [Bacteroides sp.]